MRYTLLYTAVKPRRRRPWGGATCGWDACGKGTWWWRLATKAGQGWSAHVASGSTLPPLPGLRQLAATLAPTTKGNCCGGSCCCHAAE